MFQGRSWASGHLLGKEKNLKKIRFAVEFELCFGHIEFAAHLKQLRRNINQAIVCAYLRLKIYIWTLLV